MIPKRTFVFVFVLAAATAMTTSGAAGDTVLLTNGLNYEKVRVTNAEDGMVSFRLVSRTLIKSMAEVDVIAIDGMDDFNRAESLLKEGKAAQAMVAYDTASKSARGWQKVLIGYRLMPVYERAGQLDKAVALWLAIADEAKGSPGSLAMRPKTLGPPTAAVNDRAIALLLAKAKAVSDPDYLKAIRTSLVDLYERQGKLSEAQKVAAQLAGQTVPNGNGNGEKGPATTTNVAMTAGTTELRQASLALKAGQYARTVQFIRPALNGFVAKDLPEALYLLGSAQAALARKEKDPKAARTLLLEGGLNLMRVVASFSASKRAPEALAEVAQVHEQLGNYAAARAAYQTVLTTYADSPAATRAREGLARTKDK